MYLLFWGMPSGIRILLKKKKIPTFFTLYLKIFIFIFGFAGGKGGKKKKSKNTAKPQKSNGSNWASVPLPPPPVQPLPGTELEHYGVDQQEAG